MAKNPGGLSYISIRSLGGHKSKSKPEYVFSKRTHTVLPGDNIVQELKDPSRGIVRSFRSRDPIRERETWEAKSVCVVIKHNLITLT